MRIVSPMPSCSKMPMAAADDTLQEIMIWSRRRPHSSANSVDSIAERTMQLLMISSESKPRLRSVFSCILRMTNSWLSAQPRDNFGHRRSRCRHVHCDPHQLRAGFGQLLALRHGAGDVRRIRVGHGLHDHRSAAADLNVADLDANCLSPRYWKDLHVRSDTSLMISVSRAPANRGHAALKN